MYVILYVIADTYFFIADFSLEDEHDEKLAPSSTISYSTHGDMDDPRKTKNRLGKQIYFKITLPCCYDTESLILRQVLRMFTKKSTVKYQELIITNTT